jgi:hypothetical protein
MNKIKKFFFILRLMALKGRAKRLARRTGVQYFIVRIKGNITLMSKTQFKYCRQKGVFPKAFTADNLKKVSLYYTKRK